MKRFIFPILLILASALVGWLCGYDFDHRDLSVGCWAAVTLYVAACIYTLSKDEK